MIPNGLPEVRKITLPGAPAALARYSRNKVVPYLHFPPAGAVAECETLRGFIVSSCPNDDVETFDHHPTFYIAPSPILG